MCDNLEKEPPGTLKKNHTNYFNQADLQTFGIENLPEDAFVFVKGKGAYFQRSRVLTSNVRFVCPKYEHPFSAWSNGGLNVHE